MADLEGEDIRPSAISGSWYPSDAGALREELLAYLRNAELPAYGGKLRALILPHAGYYYSGQTAAFALKAIQSKNYQRVIILSPSHQAYRGNLLTSGHSAYQTPFGKVLLDRDSLQNLVEKLAQEALLLNPIRFDREHAIEIQLPFLQELISTDFKLIPIMMMDQSLATVKKISSILAEVITSFPEGEETLLIASSDLSHYHNQTAANRLDHHLIGKLENFDLTDFYKSISSDRMEACGYGAMACVRLTAQKLGAKQLSLADYRTSGDISGDYNSVVGYLSAILSEGEGNED